MKVAVFGGTGFVGNYIIEELLNSGYEVNILVRERSEKKLLRAEKCNIIYGSINDEEAVSNVLSEVEVVIYNIGIIREFKSKSITFEDLHYNGVKKTVKLSKMNNIKRYILMSANGVIPNGTEYQKTKYKAEIYLKNNIRDWTIIRPSLIFGDSHGKMEFCLQLKKNMLSLPFPAPSFFTGLNFLNAGKFKMSPVHVKDVAEIIIKCISNNHAYKSIYHLGGDDLTWNEIIKTISTASGRRKLMVPAPVFPVFIIALLFDRYSWFPISASQLTMLLEGNICDSSMVFKRYNIDPIVFNSSNIDYL